MRSIRFIFIFVFTCFHSFAQESIIIQFVDGNTKESIPAVNLYPEADFRKGLSADYEGQLILEKSFVRQYEQWIASSVGYEKLKLQRDQLLLGRTVILSSQKQALEEVVIEADRMVAEEFTVETINQMDIYSNPSANADPILAVNSMPYSTTTDESASISLRGSSPLETGIFFNGVPIYNAVKFAQLNGIGTFSIFNTNLIQQVHVFPGNPPLEYGNVSSGMIALETSTSNAPVSQTQLIASLASYGIAHTQPIGEKVGVTVFSNYQPSSLIKAINPRALNEIESFRSVDAGVYLHARIGKRIKLKSFTYSLDEAYQFNFKSPSFNGALNQQSRRFFTVNNLIYHWKEHSLSVNTGNGTTATGYDFSQFNIQQPEKYSYYNLSYQLSKERWDLKTGISHDTQQYSSDGIFPVHGYALRRDHPSLQSAYHTKVVIPEFYGYWKRYLSKKLVLGSGYRKSLGRVANQDYLSGQFNLFYKPLRNWEFIFGIGEYHRTTVDRSTLTTLFFDSRQLSLDAKWTTPIGSVQASIFHKKTNINQREQELAGLEVFTDLKITSKFSTAISLTYLHDFTSVGAEFDQLQWDNAVNFFARWEMSFATGNGWRLNSILNLREGNGYLEIMSANFNQSLEVFEPTFATRRSQFLPYRNFSLSVSKLQPIGDNMGLVIFGNLNNILDFKNPRAINYDESYRSAEKAYFSRRLLYLGISLNF